MKSKKFVPLILLIIDIALAAVIAVSFFGERKNTAGNVINGGNNSVTQNEDSISAADDNNGQQTVSGENGTEKPTEKQTEKPTEKPAETQTDAPQQSFDTSKRPTGLDFAEWFTGDVMYNGAPAGVERITELSKITGGWKGFIYYDPENEEDSQAMELLNFYIGDGADGLTLTADWYSILWMADGTSESEDDMDDVSFPAQFENGKFTADRDTVIIFTDFYELDGKQYACGTIETPRGISGKVAMVRP